MGVIDPPQNTGVPMLVDRWFGKLATLIDSIFQRVRALDEPQVVTVSGDFAMTAENVVEYVGAGGDKIILPPASAIAGRRSRPRFVINDGAGTVTLGASGSDTLNDGSAFSLRKGEAAWLISNGVASWRTGTALLSATFQPLIATALAALTMASSTARTLWNISGTFVADGNLSLVVDNLMRLQYTINAQGHTLTSSEIRGLRIAGTETDLGGATHLPLAIADGDGLNPNLFSIIAGTARLIQTRALGIQIDNTAGLKIGTATSQKLGFYNTTPVAQQVLPTGAGKTTDDIITFLQTTGLCRQS